MIQTFLALCVVYGLGYLIGRLSKIRSFQPKKKKMILKLELNNEGWFAYSSTGIFQAKANTTEELKKKIEEMYSGKHGVDFEVIFQ